MDGVGRALLLVFCISGIWAAYVTQGVLQETLSTKRFGPKAQRFEHLFFLTFAQHVVCFCWSSLMLWIWSSKSTAQAPLWAFWSPSITNSIGPSCGIQALKYISFPAQVLAKSSKMIPVMLMGTLFYGVRYTIPEYLCTLLVAGGISIFALFKSSSKVVAKLASPNMPLGYSLCFINLGMDGFTNATQDALTERYPKTSAWQIMMGMNLWGALYMGAYLFGWNGGSGYAALDFCRRYPEVAWDILVFCLCGAVGQNFIFLTIKHFGSLANTTITTTRKFVSILVSAVWRGNPLTPQQWAGVFMVFTGLSYQILLKWRRRHKTMSASKQKSSFRVAEAVVKTAKSS